MTAKLVKLSVHKNNRMQREAKQFRKEAVENFKIGINARNVSGYSFVSWNEEGILTTAYSLRNNSPFAAHTIPDLCKMALMRRLLEK